MTDDENELRLLGAIKQIQTESSKELTIDHALDNFARNVVAPEETILDYLIQDSMDEGGFALVFDAINIKTGQEVVIKTTSLCDENLRNINQAKKNLREESRLLHSMDECLTIVNSLGYMEYKGVGYLVVEKLPFSLEDAVTQIIGSGIKYGEKRAVLNTAHSLAQALIWMEEKGIINGDIAPQNMRAVKNDNYYICKLIDFTGAYDKQKFGGIVNPTFQHRKEYTAPEALDEFNKSKGKKEFLLKPSIDMYSAGITLAATCLMAQGIKYESTGQLFINYRQDDDSLLHVMENMGVSIAFISLINSMIKPNPKERITPRDLMFNVQMFAQLYGLSFESKTYSPDLSRVTKTTTFYQN